MKRTPIKTKPVRNKALKAKVKERDGGFCAKCGEYDPKWEHDHILPLHLDGRDTLDNSQTLCRHCHKPKSNGENTTRAKADRLRARNELTQKRKQIVRTA